MGLRLVGLVALVTCLPGCSQVLGLGDFHLGDAGSPGDVAASDAAAVDASRDGAVAVDAGAFCLGSLSTICLAAAPMQPVAITGNIDTDTSSGCADIAQQAVGAPRLCVIAGTTITQSGATTVTGSLPLVLFASDSVSVLGTLDASSRAGQTGAGANDAGCAASGAGQASNQAGGGAGGSFGAIGGDGGSGQSGSGGVSGVVKPVTWVRGGCPGGAGGLATNGMTGSTAALAGSSGGAVDLVAGNTISISGSVFASGAGGGGNIAQKSGGGGGGTGGLVAVEAPTIHVTGIIAANGGAGGGGGDASTGHAGTDGSTAQFASPAAGGLNEGGTHGGPGGNGGAGAIAAQPGLPPGNGGGGCCGGGGGGGGSVGIVWVKGALTGTQISPPPQQH